MLIILIDFGNIAPDILDLFTYESSNLDLFFAKLSSFYSVPLYKRESLIIFDEVQQFPRARQLIKYLVADGRYDYLETGSLIRLKKNVENIIIPSEEEHIEMFPLDFEEFLWAMGDEATTDLIRMCFENKNPVGQPLHRKIMNDFRQYVLVGGMPQSVNAYLEEKSFGILEPKTNEVVNKFDNSICIIPGIAFDKENNRLGYGKGFYDRFLENYKGIKIGLTYRECICDKIDTDENDVKMDKIITDWNS